MTRKGSELDDREYRDYVVSSLAELQTQMKQLVGNGQPGRVDVLERRVGRLMLIVLGLCLAGAGAISPTAVSLLASLIH